MAFTSSRVVHCMTAYHATRTFMAAKTPTMRTMIAMPNLLICCASEMTANWAATT
ncbi:hypothetical protein G8O24_40855 [Bradyrhizobium sp. INPA01-394B]|uniref:Uncharacterized protein n=1 Tax=Bradyrhizobium campsiandrae TaxID=1729892 RepID=A0ABR7UAC4_9BRAD|nr:hypothetical protein [Bradyrhizobium campsiandrae]MBC9883638.1 hypothetical protein [Bradyrhizobium campsiandrae]MBC9980917.1 hypothetical protein [Bradyrhizobium campsiandrae]